MVNSPTVSVIMGVFNCEETLPDAIKSLMDQTYQDFELILCDDNSTDNTLNIAESYATKYPHRILVLNNDKNKGLNFTLHKCLQKGRGKYIARMDGDDMSLPKPFSPQWGCRCPWVPSSRCPAPEQYIRWRYRHRPPDCRPGLSPGSSRRPGC